jgi:hypothetical protein
MGVAVAGVGGTLTLGSFIGEVFKTKYIVTYIERKPGASK